MAERFGRFGALLATHGRVLLTITQRVFLVVAVLAITYYLVRHAGELRVLLSWRTVTHCFAAALLLAALHPLIALAFFLLQRHTGIAVDLSTSLAIYMRRIPARYVPGGIWHSVSRLADMRLDAGVSGAQVRRLFVFEAALVATSGLLACATGLLFLPHGTSVWFAAALQVGIGCVVVLVVLAWIGRRTAWRRLPAALLLFLAIWSLAATAFATIAGSIAMNDGSCGFLMTASTYLVAAVQGYVAIFAPQGWGVTEASFALLDPCSRALPGVLSAFLLYRLSAIVGDLLGYAVWSLLARRARVARL